MFAGRQASRGLRSTARPGSGAILLKVIVAVIVVDFALTALFIFPGLGVWLLGPNHDNWIRLGGAVAVLVTMGVGIRVLHRRGCARRWRRARPALAAQWWAFDAHCREVGARSVFVWRADGIRRGDMAYIAPVEVDGLTLTDSLFDGQRIAAGFWYATYSAVSWTRGFRSERFLWVSSVSWPPVGDVAREAAAQLWQEQYSPTAHFDELAAGLARP
jgi:hypothetical protein